jgi:hypothetical protein
MSGVVEKLVIDEGGSLTDGTDDESIANHSAAASVATNLLDGPEKPLSAEELAHIDELIAQAEHPQAQMAQAAASTPAVVNSSTQRTEISEFEWQQLLDALRHLLPHVADNDSWSQIGYALLSLQGARPAEQLWYDFSKKAAGYEPGAPEAWWNAHSRQTPRSDYRHIFSLARKRGWGATSSADTFPPVMADPGTAPPLSVEPAPAFPDVVFHGTRRDLYDNAPPPRVLMLGGYFPKGAASKLSGPGQLGKSYLMIFGAVCQALGLEFLGRACQPSRVVYVSAEDEHEEYERRLHRVLHALYPNGLPDDVRKLLARNLHFVDLTGQGGKQLLTNIVEHGRVAITPFAKYLAELVAKHRADLVSFDTQSRFNGASENDNTAGAIFIDALELVAKITGAAVVVISHVGKNREYDTDQYDRGASSLVDNTRGGMKLTALTYDEANKLIDWQQAKAKTKDILRVSHSKRSYSAKNPDAFVERHPYGVLLPVSLIYTSPSGSASVFPPTPSDYVAQLIAQVGTKEVTRRQVLKEYHYWCGPTASSELAVQAFDAAVGSRRLVFSRHFRSADWYKAAPADGSDLIGEKECAAPQVGGAA